LLQAGSLPDWQTSAAPLMLMLVLLLLRQLLHR
jgi:hypothetical protein